jgi:hypothetical protein
MAPCITLPLQRQWNSLIVCCPGVAPFVNSMRNSPETRSECGHVSYADCIRHKAGNEFSFSLGYSRNSKRASQHRAALRIE